VKIISVTPEKKHSEPVAVQVIVPAQPVVPVAEKSDNTDQNTRAISKLIEEFEAFKAALAEWRAKKSMETVPVPVAVPAPAPAVPDPIVMKTLQDMTQHVARLTDDVSNLRKAVDALNAPKPTITPLPVPAPAPNPIHPAPAPEQAPAQASGSRDSILSLIGSSAPVAAPERKVAFLSKVWDYLNQVAFEIPLRKDE